MLGLPARICGSHRDCVIGDRVYRISLPELTNTAPPVPAIVFAHGYRGTATSVMHSLALAQLNAEFGVASIAAKSGGDDWTLACHRSERFAGFVPMAGQEAEDAYQGNIYQMLNMYGFYGDLSKPESAVYGSLDFEEALASSQTDAVSINRYPDTHATYAVRSTEAGAHVFMEKRIATACEDALDIVAAANRFIEPRERLDMTDEPGQQEFCERRQRFFLDAIREDRDLFGFMSDAVNRLRILLAAMRVFGGGQAITRD